MLLPGAVFFVMEHKEGRLKMRAATLSKYLAVKELGKRAAMKQLGDQLESK